LAPRFCLPPGRGPIADWRFEISEGAGGSVWRGASCQSSVVSCQLSRWVLVWTDHRTLRTDHFSPRWVCSVERVLCPQPDRARAACFGCQRTSAGPGRSISAGPVAHISRRGVPETGEKAEQGSVRRRQQAREAEDICQEALSFGEEIATPGSQKDLGHPFTDRQFPARLFG
jgi:hypothetical protein